jgi:ATP-dependent DNA helicase RecQ
MKQYLAGFIIDNLTDVFENKTSEKKVAKELALWLSYFQLNSKSGFENNKIDYSSILAVLINLIQRGLPTKLNKYALETIVNKSSFLSFNKNESVIELNSKELSNEINNLILRSLHIIDPRINKTQLKHTYNQSFEKFGSDYEENFLFTELPNSIGIVGDFLSQLLVSQRSISSIIKGKIELDVLPDGIKNNFEEQKTDFSIQYPYSAEGKPIGIVIEIDGSQHLLPEQIFLDTERDRAVANSGWSNTLRIKTSEFGSNKITKKIKDILIPAITNEYIKACYNNYKNPIWLTDLGKEVLEVTLMPFGIARIQRTLIEAISHNILKTDATKWKIAILERDIPCAHLAIEDFKKLVEAINQLTNAPLLFPEIELQVYATDEFIKSKFQHSSAKSIKNFNISEPYDLVIDTALLDRRIVSIAANAKEVICLRSVYFPDTSRIIASTNSIIYKPFCNNKNDEGKWVIDNTEITKSIEYILQSVFRKKSFRHDQLPIINNALQCKSVIGLLPTGGGKSLTYQISALLQPGICLVINPIRSLMKDQVDGLLRNNIDCNFKPYSLNV